VVFFCSGCGLAGFWYAFWSLGHAHCNYSVLVLLSVVDVGGVVDACFLCMVRVPKIKSCLSIPAMGVVRNDILKGIADKCCDPSHQ
jgi:hypothetical protein